MKGINTLILGAWGCGAFGRAPRKPAWSACTRKKECLDVDICGLQPRCGTAGPRRAMCNADSACDASLAKWSLHAFPQTGLGARSILQVRCVGCDNLPAVNLGVRHSLTLKLFLWIPRCTGCPSALSTCSLGRSRLLM